MNLRGFDPPPSKSGSFRYKGKSYRVDAHGFLLSPREWDENFAEGTAPKVGIVTGLTQQHWKVIWFLRHSFESLEACPLVYVACRENDLGLGDLEKLFPAGYLRGACRLAGVTYREAYLTDVWQKHNYQQSQMRYKNVSYKTDNLGFLVDHTKWDENFALHTAHAIGMKDLLTEKHWRIIRFLRSRFAARGEVPTVYETCDANCLALDDLEQLFPGGYHRGAVRLSGLRVR